MQSEVGSSVKSLSQTRWSARAEACRAVRKKFTEIRQCLINLSDSSIESAQTRNEAKNLAKQMETLEVALITVFWNKVMDRFNATNLSLQKIEISLCESRQLYTSLTELVGSVRNEFDAIESEAKSLVNGADYRTTRTRPRKRQLGESVEGEVQLTQREASRIKTFIVICETAANHNVN